MFLNARFLLYLPAAAFAARDGARRDLAAARRLCQYRLRGPRTLRFETEHAKGILSGGRRRSW